MSKQLSADRLHSIEHDRLLPLILRLALPSVIGVSVSAAYQLLNAFFVGQLGTAALATMALGFPFAMCIAVIGQCFGVGSASVIARSLGSSDTQTASEYASFAFWCSIAVSAIVALMVGLFASWILQLLGATLTTIPLVVSYVHWLLLGYVAIVANMVCGFIVRAEGNTALSMQTQLISFAMNAILDPIFIFWAGWGTDGAGIATFVAQLFGLGLYFRYFTRRKDTVSISWINIFRYFEHLRNILRIGISSALNTLISILAMSVLNSLAAQYGEATVAGTGLAARLLIISSLPLNGLCIGAQSIIGYNVGANNWLRVSATVKTMLAIALCFTVTYAFLIVWKAEDVAALFSEDENVIKIGGYAIALFHYALPFLALQQVCLMFMQSKGEAKRAIMLAVLRQGVFLLPLMVLLNMIYGKNGLLYSVPFADAAVGIVSIFLLVKQMTLINSATRVL